ncbi:molybdopterin-binding protein [Paenibacillus sp. y28]|uniref:molybdopterin-binding protein n=1 Tax=Paenibacillus sp. y28 TaxID=3129110 RepID=UPI003FA71678
MLKEVPVREAIGLRLAHDLTQIIPGEFKGRLFQKSHLIREEDIPALLRIGKEHIYILDLQDGYLHEDEAALRMARAVLGENLEMAGPTEGKVTLNSTIHGLLKIHKPYIDAVNAIDEICLSTLTTNTVVQPGQPVLATRVIPLLVAEDKIARIESMARQSDGSAGLVAPDVTDQDDSSGSAASQQHGGAAGSVGAASVIPFRKLKVGLITTGSEVYHGLIEDQFAPVIQAKITGLGSELIGQRITPDHSDAIVQEIRYFQEQQADLILVTGGMSVDPDDRTPGAIKQAGADIVCHGTPMLPGSMLMMAYLGETPIVGLPGSVMYHTFTSFDVLLPRILAGERIMRQDITDMGYGGLRSDKG